MSILPDPKNFRAHDGTFLSQLYAFALMRAMTPMERQSVINALGH